MSVFGFFDVYCCMVVVAAARGGRSGCGWGEGGGEGEVKGT